MNKDDSYVEGIDGPDDKDWEELRSLFVGNENVEIEKLSEFLENPEILINKIAKILPDAINLIRLKNETLTKDLVNSLQPFIEQAIEQSAKSDPSTLSEGLHRCLPDSINLSRERSIELTESLAESLTPLIEKAVKNSSQLDIKPLSEGLYPIIGPAIRKAISSAFKQINQTLNSSLNKTFSISALKWRIQSLTTGKPFLDIVAHNTFTYQVTQVFLIHKETGLLLLDVEAPNVASKDADMVSAMLKAIQDFVQDSFSVEKNEALSTIEVGENTIWIEQGPKAILAGVIFGSAPLTVRDRFIKALEKIHIDFAKDLNEFDGDTMVFETNPQHLKYCFQEELRQGTTKASKAKWIILAILLGVGIYFGSTLLLENRRWSRYLEKLDAQPGIIVLKEGRKGGKLYLNGLRTIQSTDPEKWLSDFSFTADEAVLDWKIIQMVDPGDILNRAIQALAPPASVTLSLEGATLVATGTADRQWVTKAETELREIQEISYFDTKKVEMTDLAKETALKRLEQLKNDIEQAVFYFPLSSTILSEDQSQSVVTISNKIKELIRSGSQIQKKVTILVKGYADSSGKRELNERFGELRAKSVTSILVAEGISQEQVDTQFFIEDSGTQESDRRSKRRAMIRITILDNPTGKE